jgi:AraC-like DNA-binding protein
MPEHPVQRQIYEALTRQLLPRARQRELLPLLATIPLRVPGSIGVLKIAQARLKKPEHHPFALNPVRWPQFNLHACRYPVLAFVLDGEADVLVGLTQQRAASLKVPRTEPGIRALSLSPQYCCLFPPFTPYPAYGHPYWYRDNPETASSTSLWLRILPIGACLQIARAKGLFPRESNVIIIADRQLLPITQLLFEAAEYLPQRMEITQAYLLPLLLNIEQSWSTHQVLSLQETSRITPEPSSSKTVFSFETSRQSEVVQRACSFIQSHLAKALTLPEIAGHAYISSSHLKRLFQAELGITVAKYTMQQRLAEARSLLEQTDISVEDVGTLCGYPQRTYFSRIFTRAVGMSPRAYRTRIRTSQPQP